ncbi:DEAD/DEAH box helicase [Klebsiella pneumoniae subsp. pneumoniae]|nr:DEAD/DEAH box helicase [Klebsiella pneumoniae subsp. pneumoniae]
MCACRQNRQRKTAAFGLGLLQHIDPARFETQSLVLCPTRELADQVAGELRRPARCLPKHQDSDALRRAALWRPARFPAACPAYYRRHPGPSARSSAERERSPLTRCRPWVMDEADRMLDMGFSDAIDEVIRFAPADRQTLLFSATGRRQSRRSAAGCSAIRRPLRSTLSMRSPAIEQQFFEFPATVRLPCCSACSASISPHPAWCSAIPNAIAAAVCDAPAPPGRAPCRCSR